MDADETKSKMNTTVSNILKYLMVLIVIAFIAWLFPSHVHTQYKYNLGDRWRYDNLTAPFDFSIKKSADELSLEQNEILKDIYPFYLFDENIIYEQIKKFEARINQEIQTLQSDEPNHDMVLQAAKYNRLGKQALLNMFNLGILATSKSSDTDFINLVKEGSPQITRMSRLNTIEEAQVALADSIQSMNLSEGALLATLAQSILLPNVRFDQDLTTRYKNDAINRLHGNKGAVLQGDMIVSRSELITKDVLDKISSYEAHYNAQVGTSARRWTVFSGYLILTSLIIGVYLLYLQFHATEIFKKYGSLAFMLLWPVLFSFLVNVVEHTPNLSAYMIPFCVIPIVVKNFYSDRLALFTHIVVILIVSFLSKEGYEFTFLQILAGIVAVLTVKETRYWNKFFSSIFFIFMTYVLGYVGLELISIGNFSDMQWNPLVFFVISGVLTLLAYPMIPLLEGVFGFTSSIKLAELSDLNRPLLRDLSIKAPGTFQHSLQVANLGEAAAEAIGANGLLVKTAALYHDIGKMKEPEYFIENQRGDNPHDLLSDKESAQKIIAHVPEGEKMAKKAKLPHVLIDFINSHHGTTRAEYFYRNYLKDHPNEKVDPSEYQYPGPLPKSKEEALLMMADSLEAASKSLKSPTGQDIDALVDKIINGKIEQNQLMEADISFRDLETSKSTFKSLLRNIYHVRIEYPEEPSVK
jgi:putative nucleotidyltransferase with HDIG domain